MVGGVEHMGGLINPRPWCERCRAGSSNTVGLPYFERGRQQNILPQRGKWILVILELNWT